MLVSAAEPPILRALGEFAPQCEEMGADFLVFTAKGVVGIQRKTCADLVASLRGPRLPKEMWQSEQLTKMILLVEGAWPWEEDGWRWGSGPPWSRTFTKAHWEGVELSVQANDWWLIRTASLEDTAARLPRLEQWLHHADHDSLRRMPKAKHSSPIVRILSAFDGVNTKKAKTIVDAYPAPLQLTLTREELIALPGWGKVSADRLLKVVPCRENSDGSL